MYKFAMLYYMSVIGIHIIGDGIRIAKVQKQRKGFVVLGKADNRFSKGIVRKGVIVKPEEAGAELKQLIQSNTLLYASKAVICLSPEQVYVTLCSTKRVAGSKQRILIEKEIKRWIPEELSKLAYSVRILEKNKKKIDIAVIAIHQDVLDSYVACIKAAGLNVIGITTVPHAIASVVKGIKQPSLLFSTGITLPTVTLIKGNTLLDEAVFSVDEKTESIITEIQGLAEEYRGHLQLQDVFVCAPKDVVVSIQKTFEPEQAESEKKKAKPQSKFSFNVHPILKEIANQDRPFIGAICASLSRKSIFVIRGRKHSLLIYILGLFIACVALLGTLLWQHPYLFEGQWNLSYTSPEPIIIELDTVEPEGEEEPREPLAIDVLAGHPAYEALEWALKEGIFTEDEDGALHPDDSMKRSEFLVLLIDQTADMDITTIQERSGHLDVSIRDPYLYHLRYATQKGIVGGTEFRPDEPVTIAEALKMSYQAFGIATDEPSEGEDWYAPFLRRAQKDDLAIGGQDPNSSLIRANTAQVLQKYSEL